MQAKLSTIQDYLLTKGTDNMSIIDLLSVTLNSSRLAKSLYNSSYQWCEIDRKGLVNLGLSPKQVAQILALLEISQRIGATEIISGQVISRSADVSEAYKPRLSKLKQEHFLAVGLDNKNRIIAEHLIAKGSLAETIVNPRELFRPLIRDGAARTITLHNHPSGNPTPSKQDIALCKRLTKIGDLVGIPILDFIIIGTEGTSSFADLGLL